MKTLKKTLSLTLVFAMVFSLMSFAFAAPTATTTATTTDYKDAADIAYKEAVDVMTGIKTINGYDNGNFGPKDNLTRAQAAKMVTYAILGESVAKTLPAKTSSYKDIEGNNAWAIPSIEYLSSKGIVAGYGDGNFGPNDKVTANQLAKMLLIAVGYGKNGEYTGSGWELNAAVDASKLKLYAGTKATSYSAPATREEAALYCFNTLTTVPQVNWSKDKEAYENVKDDKTIGTSVYGLEKSDTQKVDNFGRPAAVWTVTDETDPIAQTAATPAATFTDASYVKDFASYSFADDVQILVNGEAVQGLDSVTALKSRAYNGVGIELYDTDTDKDIETIALTQGYLAKVTDYTATKGTTAGNFKLEIYNPWGTTGNKTVTDNLKSTSDLFDKLLAADYAKNDYLIVYTKAADVTGDPTILKFEAVKTVTGALSTYSATGNTDGFNGSVTVGGTKYTLASGAVDNKVAGFLSNEGSAQTLAAQLGKNVTVFIDSYGMVLGVTPEEVVDSSTYGLVLGYNYTAKTLTKPASADILLAQQDGTVAVVAQPANASGIVEDLSAAGALFDKVEHFTEDKPYAVFVSYTIADGKLTKIGTAGTSDTLANLYTAKGVMLDGATDVYLNSATTFLYFDSSKEYNVSTNPVRVVTGYANTVDAATNTAFTYILNSSSTVAKLVYVPITATPTVAGNSIYILNTAPSVSSMNGQVVYTYSGFANGEPATVVTSVSSLASAGLYTYTLVNGVTADIAPASSSAVTNGTVTIIDTGYIYANGTIRIDSNTAFYLVDTSTGTVTETDAITADSSKTYTVTYAVLSTDDVATAIYYTVS